ncbi:hypothetical protein FHT87_005155 [Rhizobium sp. BK316]|uniref:hypothetical protein n=1 Tax=Rhizobium sp. BK316 TaxID=2587053 RepID=UPI00161E3A0D|nr:hypothetical protein [Rhizobium sp. BK316]MBB3411202.1 hypothetical protein [Rhizobium sp. BK316]
MPLQTITLDAGVNVEATATQNAATIQQSQLIRFKAAGKMILVEKLGGWLKYYATSIGSAIRELHAWQDTSSGRHLAVGAEQSLSVITQNAAQNITPRTFVSNAAVDFSTTSGSTTVTIVDPNFVTSNLDSIFITTPVSVGGIVLQGAYQIDLTLSSTSYQITAATAATATVANGGAVPSFTTTANSATVTVNLADHGEIVGTTFPVLVPTTVGGITLSGSYLVRSVVDANNFTINASSLATSGATASMNGGQVNIIYYVTLSPTYPLAGYGIGPYGAGAYGLGVAPSPSSGTPITATNWSLDNWGNILLACPANGAIYSWSADSGFPVASKVVNAPRVNGGIFVSEPSQILVAWASSIDGVQDPLQINWSDSGDFTNWTVSALTQAGGYRIPTGSKIVGGLQGPQFGFIWTDVDVWAMQYIQPPLVFGFNKLAEECGLISRHSACVINSTVYWMGNNQFFQYAGAGVQPIVCSVWDFVFQDLDTDNADKIHVASNNGFGEVAWYFPSKSGGTGEVDSYIKFNFLLNCWDCGRLQRTAWIDQSVLGQPIGATSDGFIYQHEVANDADGAPMGEYFETGYAQISQGEELTFIDWMIPDFTYGKYNAAPNAALNVTLKFTDYPGSSEKSKGPYQVISTTNFRNPRIRAREVGMRIEGTGLGGWWRMGGLRYRGAPDGKR